MKITERQLRRIISEEMAIVLERLTSKTWSGDSSSGGGSGGSGGRSAVKGALKTVGAKPGEKKQTQEPTDQDNPEGYMSGIVNVGSDGKTISDVRKALRNPAMLDGWMQGKSSTRPTGKFFIVSLQSLGGADHHHTQKGKDELKNLADQKGFDKITHLDGVVIDSIPNVVVFEIT